MPSGPSDLLFFQTSEPVQRVSHKAQSVLPAVRVRCTRQPPTLLWNIDIMEWVPTVLIAFKLTVLGIGMFLAVKWHYDKAAREGGAASRRRVLRTTALVTLGFVVLVLALLWLTYDVGTKLGIDLTLP